jgi:flagellar capping protein FliD
MEHKTYTQKDIIHNIDVLTNSIDSLKLDRTSITKSINSLKKQVKTWEELNENQYKMF